MNDMIRQIDRYLDDDLDEVEIAELFEWVGEGAANADQFARHMLLHQQTTELLSCRDGEPRLHPQLLESAPKKRRYLWFAGTALTAILALTVFLPFGGRSQHDHPNDTLVEIAYLSNAQLADRKCSQGDLLGSGILHLETGIMRLDFDNGATVTLQGPAHFEIIDRDKTRLDNGILTATIPESAIGFEVTTPTMDVVDMGTSFGVSVGADGETDLCVFEGEVEVSLTDSVETLQLVREGNAVRSKPSADTIDNVDYSTERYENAWPITSGVFQANGLMKFVSPGPDFIPGKFEDSERIVVFLERSRVLLTSDLTVNVTQPGQYTRVRRRDTYPIRAGQAVRSYLLQLNPIGEFTQDEVDRARVIGQITFDRPILGLIGGTTLLNRTDRLLGHPFGDYGDSRRGIEPFRPDDQPDSGRDHVTLSQDRRTLSLDLSASSAVDQIRVVVSSQPTDSPSRPNSDLGTQD